MAYEYKVQTLGTSAMFNLEKTGARLEEFLNHEEVAASANQGWELWQVNTLNDASGVNGLILVFRRPLEATAQA